MKDEENISIPLSAFKSVLSTVKQIEEMTSKKANVGYKGKYTVEDIFALTLSCMSFGASQDLLGYLSENDKQKILKNK